jgi:uncharacterized membrane protein
MDALFDIIRPIHGLAGATVLVAGAVAIATRKGSTRHKKAGKVFYWAMIATVVLVIPRIVETGNILLSSLGVLVLYMVRAGRREILRKRKRIQPTRGDYAALYVTAAASAFLAGFGVWMLATTDSGYSWVCIGFGALGFWLTSSDWTRWRAKEPPPRHQWMLDHLGYMGGSYIAATTAFAAVNITWEGVPKILIWGTPTLIGIPLILLASRRVTARFGEKKPVPSAPAAP